MWGAILQLVLGAGSAIYSGVKKKRAQNKLDNMEEVDYSIPQGYADNVGLTAEQAETGFDAETLNTLLNQYSQNLSATNTSILQAGGGFNDIAKSYGVYTDSVNKLGVQNSVLKNQKIENYLQASSTYAGQEALKWKLNKYDKDRNDRAAASALISGYNQGINKGINQGVQGAAGIGSYLQSNGMESQYNKMVKDSFSTTNDLGAAPTFYNNNFDNPNYASPQYANQNEQAIELNNVNQMWNF